MERLIRKMIKEVIFFDGKLLTSREEFLESRWESFIITTLPFVKTPFRCTGLSPPLPDDPVIDPFHLEDQKKKLLSLFNDCSILDVVQRVTDLLQTSLQRPLNHPQELAECAIKLLGDSSIQKALEVFSLDKEKLKCRFFKPDTFNKLAISIVTNTNLSPILNRKHSAIKERTRKIQKKRTKTGPDFNFSKPFDKKFELFKLRPTNFKHLNPEDLSAFNECFSDFQQRSLTVTQMHTTLSLIRPNIASISRSTFYRRFIKENGIKILKTKMRFSVFNAAKKKECRIITFMALCSIWQANNEILFYDETTISQEMTFQSSWFRQGDSKLRFVKGPIKYFKLNIVTIFHKIISFSITEVNFGVDQVADFLSATAAMVFENESFIKTPYLVLDSSPKNRTKQVFALADKKYFRFVYTTPTTPQQNFAECIFQRVKTKLKRTPIINNTHDRGLYLQDLVKNLIGVLQSLNQVDFDGARKAYLFDIKSTVEVLKKKLGKE